jgi:hypothetical protein
MALNPTKFATLDGGVQQLHIYNTTDTFATCVGSGYFNDITNRLKQWDFILVAAKTGSAPAIEGNLLIVTSATGAAVVTTFNAMTP